MTTITKIRAYQLPINSREYVKGNRFTAIKSVLRDREKGMDVKLIEKIEEQHELLGKVRKTIKELELHGKIPSIVRKFIPNDACIVTETSYTGSLQIHTEYTNKHFKKSVFNVVMNTVIEEGSNHNSPFETHINTQYYKNFESDSEKESLEYCTVYKKVTVEVNNYFLGWIAKEVDKSLESVLFDHHKDIISFKKEWSSMSEADLEALENDILKWQKS